MINRGYSVEFFKDDGFSGESKGRIYPYDNSHDPHMTMNCINLRDHKKINDKATSLKIYRG